MEALMTALMLWASAFTGLPVAERFPQMVFKDACVIEQMYEGAEADCTDSFRAVAVYDAGAIFLPTGWEPSDIYAVSTLLHELVHHMQHEAGITIGAGAQCVGELEKPAYEAQIAFLDAAGLDAMATMEVNDLFLMMVTRCERGFF